MVFFASAQYSGSDRVWLLTLVKPEIKKDSTITGSVVANGVNDPSTLPTLIPGVEAQVDQNVDITGSLQADSIGNEPLASTGETLCNEIQGTGPLLCDNLPVPLLFPIVVLPSFQATETDTSVPANVSVGNNQSTTLAAGTYKDIILGKNASVCFSGGVYDIRSIIGGEGGQNLAFQAPSEVRLDGDLTLGSSPFIGADDGNFGCFPAGSTNPTAAEIVFFIAGSNVVTGAGKANDPGNLNANFYLGSGAMETGKDTDITGTIIARDYTMNRDSMLTADGAFNIEPVSSEPTANPQDVGNDGINPTVNITLTGSDPEGGALTFAVTNLPIHGTLYEDDLETDLVILDQTLLDNMVTYTPTQPFGICSVTVQTCTDFVDSLDCPGGETCLRRDDSFSFAVTDPELLTSLDAVVNINGTGEADANPAPVTQITANDGAVETTKNTAVTVLLSAAAPDSLSADLVFSIITDPSAATGTVGTPVSVPESPVRSATAEFTPAVDFTCVSGDSCDSFVFEACEDGNPTNCDTATVTLAVFDDAVPVAPEAREISVVTEIDTPLEIDLGSSNEGTTEPSEPDRPPKSLVIVSAKSAHGNGYEEDSYSGGPITVDAGWSATETVPPAFFWSGTPPVFSSSGPFTFSGEACVSVTDDFLQGDQFSVYDNGQLIGTTPLVPIVSPHPEVGPDAAFDDPTYSSGTFSVGEGSHSISVELSPLTPSLAAGGTSESTLPARSSAPFLLWSLGSRVCRAKALCVIRVGMQSQRCQRPSRTRW